MRPRRLYTKIFLSFLAVLFVTELLIFILFLAVPFKRFAERFEGEVRDKVLIVRSIVNEKIQSQPHTPLEHNTELSDFVSILSRFLEAMVWITDTNGKMIVRSFEGPLPDLRVMSTANRVEDHPGFQLYRNRKFDFYAIIRFTDASDQESKVHIYLKNIGHPPPHGYFALGLILIGVTIALLVIPISRPITRRVIQLRQSTLRIADGDLSHRVATSGKDEIAELGSAFNQMTTKLESMIINSRELTANVSHELRTPLTRIRISEELLREKLDLTKSEGLVRHLEDIREDIEILDTLVQRILELSKLDMQAAPMVFEPLDVAALIGEIVDRFRPVMDLRRLDLTLALPDRLEISGNREGLSTVFSNLLDNAVKFTPESGAIRIEAEAVRDGLQITMANTCDVLPEDELSRIFNPFHRVHKFQTTGSGLGLAIVKKTIEAHGGTIMARNTEYGLAFKIMLHER
jgi:signal transduction histidine kinase